MAFIMHSLSWLANNGGCYRLFLRVLCTAAAQSRRIRKYLVDNNFVDAIIQLPSNLFPECHDFR